MWSTPGLVELHDTLKMVTSTKDIIWFHTSQNFNTGRNMGGFNTLISSLSTRWSAALQSPFSLLPTLTPIYQVLDWVYSVTTPLTHTHTTTSFMSISIQTALALWAFISTCALPGNIVALSHSSRETPCWLAHTIISTILFLLPFPATQTSRRIQKWMVISPPPPPNSALFDLETAPCSTLALQRLLSGPAPCHLLSGCGCSTQPAVEEGQGQSLRAWGTAWASWRFRSMMPGGLTLASSSSLPRLCMALPRSCMACFWVTLFCGSPVGRGLQPSPWLLLGPLLSLAACPILALRWLGVGCGGVGGCPMYCLKGTFLIGWPQPIKKG